MQVLLRFSCSLFLLYSEFLSVSLHVVTAVASASMIASVAIITIALILLTNTTVIVNVIVLDTAVSILAVLTGIAEYPYYR